MKTLCLTFVFLLVAFTAPAQVPGCTDPLSVNYNPEATVNDGSCTYVPALVIPEYSVELPEALRETSGLVIGEEYLYTHNDNSDINIYALDSITGQVAEAYAVTGALNQDWEEIAQDEEYIYIGDFGNNANGNRQDLKILKIAKEEIFSGNPEIETISFSYADQTDFSPAGSNNTDFDCEAFIVGEESIYLFTKQWVSGQTSVYELPKAPGTYVAELGGTYNVDGLITGAAYLEDLDIVVLSGYNSLLQPFFFLLYDFKGNDFFGGNKRKVNIALPFHQVEGVATANGLSYFATNEYFSQQPVITVEQQLHKFDLSYFLEGYIGEVLAAGRFTKNLFSVYPNPVHSRLFIEGGSRVANSAYSIYDINGREVLAGTVESIKNGIDVGSLDTGIYIIRFSVAPGQAYKMVKQ